MPQIDWGLAQTDPVQQQARGNAYAETLRQQAAKYQAGSQFATGDYTGAAQTQAQAGDIPQAQATQQFGQQQAGRGQQYIAQALPVFQAVAQAHQNDPDKGAAALGAAFDHIATEAQAVTGAQPQQLAAFRQQLVTDPQGTLQRLQAQVPINVQKVGDNDLVAVQGRNVTPIYQGTKNTVIPQGGSLVQTGGVTPASGSQPAPNAVPPAAGAGSPPSGQVIPSADPTAMHTVESGNNPAAVSPAGAVGISQTMPGTLQSPGFGVAPAADNSPAEQQRVGDQYLQALNAHYGNAALAHIAYNMGPGATDKWLAAGGKFSQLPAETQDYLGKIAVAQAVPQGGQAPASTPQQPGGARVVASNGAPIDHDAINNDVKIWLASKGTISPNYGFGAAGFAMRQAFDSAKNKIMGDLNVAPEDVASGQAIRKADTANLTNMSRLQSQIGSFEQTAVKNADLALSLAPKGGAQGGVPLINRWIQAGRKSIGGDPDVAAFNAALGTFADEYAKVVSGSTNGSGTTDAAKATAESRINSAMTQQQLQSVIGVMKQEMANRTSSLGDSVNQIKQRLGASAPQSSDGIPTMSPIEAAKAPPGTKFRGTDGVVRVRK